MSAHELCITLDIIKVQHMEHHQDGHVQVDHGLEGEDVPLCEHWYCNSNFFSCPSISAQILIGVGF